jgi:uncharacterized membrane protein
MEFVIFLLFILVILLILVLRYSLLDKMDRLEEEMVRLREELRGREGAEAPKGEPVRAPDAKRVSAEPREMEPFRPIPRPVQLEKKIEEKAPAEPTDWEKFIGENLISKIGIAILVLAIGFFVKYAIDNDWVGPVGRVGIGLLCGAILIGLAHRLRKEYKAFSSVLIGGGLAVLYFTIALAYHQYHLFWQTTAFVLMLVITAFSVVLSLLYNREELAIIALAGGFVTPFLVSNGSGNYQVLFTYLLILNTGLLVIAYFKAWRLLNGLAFGFTVVLFGSWLVGLPDYAGRSTYYGGAAYGTAFYGLYFIAGVARTIREKKKFIASDFLILLLNTCLYFGVSLYFLSRLGLESYKGLYCAIMGVIHIVLSWLLFRRQSVEPAMALIMLYAAAALLYISGALEIGYQFNNRFPNLDIASFYLLLYTWVFISLFAAFSGRLKVTNVRVLNIVLLGLGLVVYLFALPLVMGLQQEMLEGGLDLNHFGAHWVGAAVVLFILYRLTELYRAGSWRLEAAVFTWAVAIVAVIFFSAEGQMLVNLMFYSRQHPLDELRQVYDKTGLPILWGLCSFVCMWLGMRHKFRPLRIFSLVLFSITLLKLFLFDIRGIPIAGKIAAFFCLGVLLLVVSFMYQRLKKIIIDNEAKIQE